MNFFYKRRIEKISKLLKIERKKIITYLHEDCHITYIIFKERKDGIAITAEGLGDYSNGSVSTLKNSVFSLRPQTQKITLSYLSVHILLLGMNQ